MPFLRLFFLRHGQTVAHGKLAFNGWTDVDLTDEGRRQLDEAALALRGLGIDAVYSSDLKRAVYGGTALAGELGLQLRAEPRFREVNFGLCEGLVFSQIRERFPGLAEAMLRPDGGEFRFPEGETGDEFRKRIGAALGELRRKHPEGRVALVCHAGVCGAILAEAMGLSNAAMWSVVQDFGCLNVIDFFEGGGSRVRLVNGYLGPEGYRWPGPGRDRLALAPNK